MVGLMQGVTGEPQNDRSLQTCKLLQPVSLFKTVLQKPDEGRHHATDKADCNISVINLLRTVMMQPSTTRLDPASFSPVCMPVVGSVVNAPCWEVPKKLAIAVGKHVQGQARNQMSFRHFSVSKDRHSPALRQYICNLQHAACAKAEGI